MRRIHLLFAAATALWVAPVAAWFFPAPPRPPAAPPQGLATAEPASTSLASGGSQISRRETVISMFGAAAMALTLSTVSPGRATASDEEITDKAYLDVDIGGKPVGRVVVGLYGKSSPVTVENFIRLVEGRAVGGATYLFSTVFRVEKGKCIDLGRITGGGGKRLDKKINESGYMRVSTSNAADWTLNADANSLRHDEPFLLTTKKGGGTYEWSITLSPNKKLDNDHLVFGKVLSGKEVLDEILKVPVSKEDPIGSKQVFAAAGKGFDPRAKIIFLNKPLRKITVKDCGRLV